MPNANNFCFDPVDTTQHILSVLDCVLKYFQKTIHVSSSPPIVGSFMIGSHVFDAESLFKSLRAIGLDIEATPEGLIINGVLIKPDAKIDENVCPLAKVCERRAYFLELLNKKASSGKNSFLRVEPEVEELLKTIDNPSDSLRGQNFSNKELDPALFGNKTTEKPRRRNTRKNKRQNNSSSQQLQSLTMSGIGDNNEWDKDFNKKIIDKDEEIVKKALKQIFSPQNKRKKEEFILERDFYPNFESLRKPCPSCGEFIPKEWDVCPSCGFIFR